MYIYIAIFVAVFNTCLFLLPFEVMDILFGMIGTLQTFRAIGTMGSTMLPDDMKNFYAKLGLVTLDYVRACVRVSVCACLYLYL